MTRKNIFNQGVQYWKQIKNYKLRKEKKRNKGKMSYTDWDRVSVTSFLEYIKKKKNNI